MAENVFFVEVLINNPYKKYGIIFVNRGGFKIDNDIVKRMISRCR